MKKDKTLNFHIYEAGGKITLNRLEQGHKGMYSIVCGNSLHQVRVNDKAFPEYLVNFFKDNVNPKFVDRIVIEYPLAESNFPSVILGYFGRRDFVVGTYILNPLDDSSREMIQERIKLNNTIKIKNKLIHLISN